MFNICILFVDCYGAISMISVMYLEYVYNSIL